MWGSPTTGLCFRADEYCVCVCLHLVLSMIFYIISTLMPHNSIIVSFKCKDTLESKLNICISDIKVWMIKNYYFILIIHKLN